MVTPGELLESEGKQISKNFETFHWYASNLRAQQFLLHPWKGDFMVSLQCHLQEIFTAAFQMLSTLLENCMNSAKASSLADN